MSFPSAVKYFDETPIGSLVTRLVSDIEAIAEVFSSGFIDILGDLLMLIVVVIIMVFTNWKLTFWRGNPAVTNHTISKTR
jgi:ATP-binding cassette subfamily B protein